jgi:formylglycine-generating enzyme required for sulfatase activity
LNIPEDRDWGKDKRPVINISWFDAINFCNWLSEKVGYQKVYSFLSEEHILEFNRFHKYEDIESFEVFCRKIVKFDRKANGFRLPIEFEWEYAARERGKDIRFGNGKDFARYNEISFDCSLSSKNNYSTVGEDNKRTKKVGSYEPNKLGLYDMSGNIKEWCWDIDFEYDIEETTEDINYKYTYNPPPGIEIWSKLKRCLRGGSWRSPPQYIRCVSRSHEKPSNTDDTIGFRVARNAD